MKEFIMTLGQEHCYRVKGLTIDKDCAVVIKAKNESEARDIMFELTDGKFCTSYSKEYFEADGLIQWFPRGYVEIN